MNEQQNAAAQAMAAKPPDSTIPTPGTVLNQSAAGQPCPKCQAIAAVTGNPTGGACTCFDCRMG